MRYATEYAQLTERHRTASRFECGGDAFVDGDRDGDGFDRSVEHIECEGVTVLLELDRGSRTPPAASRTPGSFWAARLRWRS